MASVNRGISSRPAASVAAVSSRRKQLKPKPSKRKRTVRRSSKNSSEDDFSEDSDDQRGVVNKPVRVKKPVAEKTKQVDIKSILSQIVIVGCPAGNTQALIDEGEFLLIHI